MNYEELLSIHYQNRKWIIIFAFLFLAMVIMALNVTVCDVYNTFAYYQNNNLILKIPIAYSDTVLTTEFFKINNNEYEFNIVQLSNLLVDTTTMTNYQEIILEIPESFPENTVVQVAVYYNKEKVYKKIQKLL